ncbi:uncharacterized protein LOC18431963 [Amborella trichopoda]|uniref:DUF7906 domain-containing protein n=1 Tax=Amborella trichopoda TaxID=13333 RepID=W1P1V0_AMBTC|nr:uncharacterized protein LOC18431963 [Amborella trichopoda]ERN03812.1 hypothetical protein AMTR_s00078p00118850 [Amborella trichopoda]|eukprot:XP_006842137.1 uncharacterized protein LOC18431963 [Amborella trichopoda]
MYSKSHLPLFFSLLSLFLSRLTSSSVPHLGIDSFLSDELRHDPQALNDSFLSLHSSLLKSLSLPSIHSHRQLLSHLTSLTLTVPVKAILVGDFSGADPSETLTSLFSSLHFDPHFPVIFSSDPLHRLIISREFHLEVSRAPSRIASRLQEAIKAHIEASTSGKLYGLHPVPYSVIDDIIGHESRENNEYTLYLLNLKPQSKTYAYSYTPGDPSPAFPKCLGSLWTGKDRYLWVDLAAGPVDYGPSISGEGVLPRGEFHPLTALHGKPKSHIGFLADLTSLIWSASRVLFAPSLRIPAFFDNPLIVQFVHIHGSGDKDLRGLDWDSIESAFMDEVKNGGSLLGQQELKFRRSELKFPDCPICNYAILRSMNSYTSRFLFDNYTLIVSEYLDSKRLHSLLSESAQNLKKLAGISDDELGGRILPVYVFDLELDRTLLLDRFHQAVAFKDMVIAVRTRSSQSVTDYSCNGRHVITQIRELERPIVGSLLQTLWGVSPTHLSWSPLHNNTLVDYTWSMGQTPFGPFSRLYSLSFVQKDAAKRNIVLTMMNYTITSLMDALESLESHGGYKEVLKPKRFVEFTQRWNLLRYKMDRAVSAMSHLDFETALYFVRSGDHDVYAIHTIIYLASQELEGILVCFQDPPFPWASASMSLGAFAALLYVYSKRDQIFRSKRKQF